MLLQKGHFQTKPSTAIVYEAMSTLLAASSSISSKAASLLMTTCEILMRPDNFNKSQLTVMRP